MQSATKPHAASASTAGPRDCSAFDAPVERTATGTVCTGETTWMWKGRAPSRSKANSASCTLTPRDWVSDRIAQASPGATLQSSKTRTNAAIHLASMRSVSMTARLHESR